MSTDALEDLRSRLACIAEATYWDRPYDERLNAIRGMCDLTTDGMTPQRTQVAPSGARIIAAAAVRDAASQYLHTNPDIYDDLVERASHIEGGLIP